MTNNNEALVATADGQVAYDAVKLATIETEGVFLKDCLNSTVTVRTQNTTYQFTHYPKLDSTEGVWEGVATKDDGTTPRYLQCPTRVHINGSTWGGSMLKVGYVGVGMHLEFSTYGAAFEGDRKGMIRTSEIQSVTVTPKSNEHYWGTNEDWVAADASAPTKDDFMKAMDVR
jgi:hypothetical protein